MKKYRQHLLFLILIHFVFSRVVAEVHVIQSDRKQEVIRVTADKLLYFLGTDIQSIKIYRYLDAPDIWEPVPFQIDVPNGSSYQSKESGILEDTDQILFMARDLGDKASITRWVDDAEAGNKERTVLIAVDPLTQDTGRVYVYLSEDLTGSQEKYLTYDEEDDIVESGDYLISHGEYGLQDSILFKSAVGGDNIDFFDTQKLRFKVRIIINLGIFGKIKKSVTITEETRNKTVSIAGVPLDISMKNIRTEYSCTGTIHLQRSAVFEIRFDADGIGVHESSKIYLKTHFFPHYTEWRADEVTIPEFDEGKIKMMRFSADLNENSVGMIFYNQYNQSGVRIDGVSSQVDTTIEWDYNWYLIHADPEFAGSALTTGSVLSVMDLKVEPLGDEQQLWFRDNDDEDNDDTGDKRSYGDVGVLISGSSISGQLSFLNRTYYIPEILSYDQAEQEIEKDKHRIETSSDYQYPLHITTLPAEGGQVNVITVTDSSFGKREVTLTAVPDSDHVFSSWSGDLFSKEDTLTVLMDSPKYIIANFTRLRDITVTTDPAGLNFIADDETYTAPHTFTWTEGSTHTLSVDSLIQPGEEVRYIFSEWSSGESRNFAYTVPSYNEIIIGNFMSEFRVYTNVDPEVAGFIVLTPSGEWFERGTLVQCEAFPQGWYTFIKWGGDLDEEENPVTVSIDSSMSIEAIFGNYPPVVSLPDIYFNEDDTLSLNFEFFDQWITDSNNPDSTLTVSFQEGEYITFRSDSSAGKMKIFTKNSNWYGSDSLLVVVEDPLHDSGQDHLNITVFPVNDTPLPFSLLEPADETEITQCSDSLRFYWQRASDPDPGDSVKYIFELDTIREFTSPFLIKKNNIEKNYYNFMSLDSLYNTIYYWQVTAVDTCDSARMCDKVFTFYLNTSAVEETETVPNRFILQQNYPNPFNHYTVIGYGLPESEMVGLYIMNSRGQKVCTLVNNKVEAGYHTVDWNGKDENGRIVSSGIYFIVLATEENRLVRKALFLK
ncbi:MAG: T9SS type A sorting domain-containing protein [bacterium]